jgi:hypothetical protein
MKMWIMSLLCVVPLPAQTQIFTSFRLDNGVHVDYQIWSGVESQQGQKSVSAAKASGDVIRRTLYTQDGAPWLGFEIHVEATDNSDFQILFLPTAGFPFFEKAPLARRVHDGDRIMMDVLEQPGTGKKVFDLFQLYRQDTHHAMLPLPAESIPSVIPAGTELRLSHPKLRLAGARVNSAQEGTTISGPQIAVDVPGIGRFRFSSSPQPGYLMEALAEDGTIVVAGADRYTIQSDTPVVEKPGSWFVWVNMEPASGAATAANTSGPAPLEVAATSAGAGRDGTRPGYVLSIKNLSPKNVMGYSVQMHFTSSVTGKGMGSSGHSSFANPLTGKPHYLQPGQTETSKRAIPFPQDASGATPNYTISVQLVVFEDGSTWGPASSNGAQQLLKEARAAGALK